MTKTIFVVDDDPDMIKVLGFRLQKAGFKLQTFTLGQEALKKALETPPSLIVLDIQMPDISGHEISAAIEQNEKTKNLPIIFLSGKVDFDPTIENKTNRAMFIKPCDFNELVARINEMT